MSARTGIGVYGYLSNVTHPTLYPVRELHQWQTDTAEHSQHAVAISMLPIDFLERQASVAAVCFFNTVSYVTAYFGWPRDHHERLANLLNTALPGCIAG